MYHGNRLMKSRYADTFSKTRSSFIVNIHVVLVATVYLCFILRLVPGRHTAKVIAAALEVNQHEGLGCPVIGKAAEQWLLLGCLQEHKKAEVMM
jgi:hypothetical protein